MTRAHDFASRVHQLGVIGEQLARDFLRDNGFEEVRPLGRNYKYADLYATKDNIAYVISVKARNKWQYPRPGQKELLPNTRFKLGNPRRCLVLAAEAAKENNAIPAWLALALEPEIYDAYFGTLDCLKKLEYHGRPLKGTAIMMSERYFPSYTIRKERIGHNLGERYELIRNFPAETRSQGRSSKTEKPRVRHSQGLREEEEIVSGQKG